jgi:ribonuclease HI
MRWRCPDHGVVKLNVDASYVMADGSAGTGMILRDSNGTAIFAACRTLFHCFDPLEAELEACVEGLRLALQWSSEPIELESDCLEAITLLKLEDFHRSIYVHQILEMKELLVSERRISLSHVFRSRIGLVIFLPPWVAPSAALFVGWRTSRRT